MENNENNNFVLMEIQIWNNKDSNGLFYYNNNLINEFKNVYFTFHKKTKNCFLIKTKDNYIQSIDEHKKFNENEGKEILFKIRNSLKNNNIYEVINPIIEHKLFESEYNNFINDKIWFSVKSHSYLGGNTLNYNLNENDIIKFGKKKYNITKIHFANDNRKENIIDEDFYKNNNISFISIINKKSKPIFNIDIKPNKYKIRNNKNINIEKANEEKANKVNEVNIKESKNINQNNNEAYIDNNINTKNTINSKNNNISINNASNQNNDKNGKNNYQNSSVSSPTNDHSNNAQNGNENNNNCDSDSENTNDKCWLCCETNFDEENPLVRLCNCCNYIHFECLKSYMNSKIIVTENSKKTVTTYTCLKFNCDICLKPYQLSFRIPEIKRTYELIDLNLPEETDYICLESLDYIKDNNNIKIVHIVQLGDEEINIGRNNCNDIIIEDISVSSYHAVLKYNKNNQRLFLENKNGKYGTLVLVRGNIKIREEKTYFQILNTHISMELINKKNLDKIYKELIQNSAIISLINNNKNNNYENGNGSQ